MCGAWSDGGRIAAVLVAVSLVAACGIAEDREASGFLVLGAAALPDYPGSDDSRAVPFAVARWTEPAFELELEGLEGRVDVLRSESGWAFGPAASVTIPRDEDVDSAAVGQLPQIDAALELGAFAARRWDIGGLDEGVFEVSTSVRQDVVGAHDGFLVTPEAELFFAANYMLRFGVAVNTTFASEDYQETYFGVDPQSAQRSGLRRFGADAGFRDVGAEAYSILSFSERTGVFFRVAYNRMLGDAADSPVVVDEGDADTFFFGVGGFFRF